MTTRRPSHPLPDLAVAKVKRFCDHKVPAHVRDQLVWEVETRGRAMTIYERRPPWHPDDEDKSWTKREIAKFRYDSEQFTWTLYWADRNGKWLKVPDASPAGDVDPLLRIVDENRTGAFD